MSSMQTKWKKLAIPAALGIVVAAGAVRSQAQPPDDGSGPPQGGSQGQRPAPPTAADMQARRAKMLRDTLTKAGYTDTTLQDAVVAYAATQEMARQNLRDLTRKLRDTVLEPTTTDTAVSTQLAALQTALAAEKTRSAAAQSALNAKISYTSKVRLNALLTSMGLVGDAAAYANPGGGQGGPGGRGGWGGRGGRGGWPGGGQGGWGGGQGGPGGSPDSPPPGA